MSRSESTNRDLHSLNQILPMGEFVSHVTPNEDIQFRRCHSHPGACGPDDVFVAGLDGADIDLAAVELAVSNGVSGIVCEQLLPFNVSQCIVEDCRVAYGEICQRIAGKPCEQMLTIGVLGTHGKTTAALAVASVMKHVTGSVAYRTSLGVSDSNDSDFDLSTNPTAAEVAKWLDSSQQSNAVAAVVELTDEMLMSKSVSGMKFDVLLISSFRKSQKHNSLKSRGIEAATLKACELLSDHGVVVYNADDARLGRFVQQHELPALGYGLDADADVQGRRMAQNPGENRVMISAGAAVAPLDSRMEGDANARHLLGAVATAYAFGLELHEVVAGAERLTSLPGRMEPVVAGQDYRVMVDLADQADRLAVSLHAMSRHHGGPVTCVAEVPSAATPEQRAAYGRVLERAADQVILTNTRFSVEAGQKAMWEVVDGCENPSQIELIPNRESALRFAIENLPQGSQLLVAGLGEGVWPTEHGWETDAEVLHRVVREVQPASAQTEVIEASGGIRVFRGE